MTVAPDLSPTLLEALRSPVSGARLRSVAPELLSDAERLWPCVDGIPFLRLHRDDLRREAVERLQHGDRTGALALLLADRKDDSIPCADAAGARAVAEGPATAQEAMAALGYGALAVYMLHRWSHPTYLSGLSLLEIHAPRGGALLEVGCGLGHFLRPWVARSGPAIGSDMVYSHLWLARRFVAPLAQFVCFDANGPFPLADNCVTASFSHDALHYFQQKDHAVAELRRVSTDDLVLIGHAHNASQVNLAPGLPLTVEKYLACVRPELVYDDAELTRAALSGNDPRPATVADLEACQAMALSTSTPTADPVSLLCPDPRTPLTVNPLLTNAGPEWPSARFVSEFVRDWDYLREMERPADEILAAVLARADLAGDPLKEQLVRRRILLDLPERWM